MYLYVDFYHQFISWGMCVFLVLIGPPTVGKTTLADKLKIYLENSKVFSFDKEFPLERITTNEDGKNSKDFRKEFLELICLNYSIFEWIIIDDTCHLKSMQKRYIKLELESEIKVIFLYISARNDQIPDLQLRNLNRSSLVNCDEIERITRHLNSFEPPMKNNFIEFNFETVPEIEIVTETIREALRNYKYKIIESPAAVDLQSASNFFNQLNLALNKEISNAFKDGKIVHNVSKQKKEFLLKVRQSNRDRSIDSLVEEFRMNYLH